MDVQQRPFRRLFEEIGEGPSPRSFSKSLLQVSSPGGLHEPLDYELQSLQVKSFQVRTFQVRTLQVKSLSKSASAERVHLGMWKELLTNA